MPFIDLVKQRYSCRAYKPDAVAQDAIRQILEAGRLAPSACNFQPWYFIVLQGREQVDKLAKAYTREWFAKAPCVIVVCVDRRVSWKRADEKEFGDVDAAIALDHMILAATELGLGTCWVGAFDAVEASRGLGVPDGIDPVLLCPMGYPADVMKNKPRKALSEIVKWGRF